MKFHVMHPRGVKRQAAVPVSRQETSVDDQTPMDDVLTLLVLFMDAKRGMTYTLDAYDGCPDESQRASEVGETINIV